MAGEGTKGFGNRWLITAHAYNSYGTSSGATYAAGDLVGTKMTFEDVIPEDYGGGAIRSVRLIDYNDQMAAMDLLLFGADLSSSTGGSMWATGDNAALDLADTDLTSLVAAISIGTGDYKSFADNAVAEKEVDIPFYLEGTRKLYGLLVTRGTPAYASTDDLIITIGVERDAI